MKRTNETMKKIPFGRDFILMAVGQVVSIFGNTVLSFALSMLVLDMTGSASIFALVSALSMIPTILLIPFGGVLADRVSKKRIMACLDFTVAGLIALFFVGYSAFPGIAVICVMKVLLSIIESFYMPSVNASVPALVEEENLTAANGVVQVITAFSQLLGPIVGGLLYGLFGLTPILTVSAVCFLASAIMECFLHIPHEKKERTGGLVKTVFDDFGDAVRFMAKEQKILLWLILCATAINMLVGSLLSVGLPYIVKIYMGLSSQMYGLVSGAMGLGSILGGVTAGVVSKKLTDKRVYITLIIASVFTVPMGVATIIRGTGLTAFGLLLLGVLAMMTMFSLSSVMLQTLLQKLTPGDMMGKIMSLDTALSMCAMPVGHALYGVLFDAASAFPYVIVWFGGAACFVIGLFMKRIMRNAEWFFDDGLSAGDIIKRIKEAAQRGS